ncbi:MAG: hypothetical protein ACTHMS_04440 [Jatrophihabitans sp.]|uniref:hypothetical protein n=1 Tax=Jatrophihabitans sp. TaxID=1932789 RepID=UPI003F7EEBA1
MRNHKPPTVADVPTVPAVVVEAPEPPAPQAAVSAPQRPQSAPSAPSAPERVTVVEVWPSTFPQSQVEALLDRLDAAEQLRPAEMAEALRAVLVEARRLRTTVARLATDRIGRAEQEADEILAEAHLEAADIRARANEAARRRITEADEAADAVETSGALQARVRLAESRRYVADVQAEISALQHRLGAALAAAGDVLPTLDAAADNLDRLQSAAPDEPAPVVQESVAQESDAPVDPADGRRDDAVA